ncbi:MAG: hypothetical protein M1819_003284 [Sarea resinae]|nr:MAG: hypothetical protein M1819_003284 [Sarea resinae]
MHRRIHGNRHAAAPSRQCLRSRGILDIDLVIIAIVVVVVIISGGKVSLSREQQRQKHQGEREERRLGEEAAAQPRRT